MYQKDGCLLSVYFCFQGLDDESQERGKLLGTYTYDEDGEALQTYAVTVSNISADFSCMKNLKGKMAKVKVE